MNYLKENPFATQNFKMRYLIKERQEEINSSWCSDTNKITTVRSKSLLQYSLDGATWIDVLTEIERDK